MKKITKSKHVKNSKINQNTGVALLLCFIIASIAVAIALRQIALERRLKRNIVEVDNTKKIAGVYVVTNNAGKNNIKKLTLTINSDRTAKLATNVSVGGKDSELTGNWSGDSNGTIITNFQDKIYAFSYEPDLGALRLLNPDVEIWGAATSTLIRQ